MGYYRNNREDGFRPEQPEPWVPCDVCGDEPWEIEDYGRRACRHCWKHTMCVVGNHPSDELTFYGHDSNRGVDVHYCALCSTRIETPSREAA